MTICKTCGVRPAYPTSQVDECIECYSARCDRQNKAVFTDGDYIRQLAGPKEDYENPEGGYAAACRDARKRLERRAEKSTSAE
jgi:hypothetical protein